MKLGQILGTLAAMVGVTPLFAQQAMEPEQFQPTTGWNTLLGNFSQWRETNGANWRFERDQQTGFVSFLYGGATAPAFTPRSEADFASLARLALDNTSTLHGISTGTLVEDYVKLIPLGTVGSTDKMSVRFIQQVSGVPVVHGSVNVLMARDGSLLSIQAHALPDMEGFDVSPSIGPNEAIKQATRWFENEVGASPETVSVPRLVIDQIEVGKYRIGVLAWEVTAETLGDGSEPAGYLYRVNANDRSLTSRENTIHYFDVSGTVTSRATPGVAPDVASNPTTLQNMPYIRITSPQGNAIADVNGNFTIVGATAPVSATVRYEGTYVIMNNQAQADYQLVQNLTAASGNSIVMNNPSTGLVTAEANSFLWLNKLRDFVFSRGGGDTTQDFPATSNVNINQNCNAFFNGSSVNFYVPGGGCPNTAYSSVVAHEMGHWLNVLYNTNNGPDGMGEGAADVWALYLTDTQLVGQDFCGTGCHVRNGINSNVYWGDSSACPYGGVHNCGQAFMGGFWRMRVRLKNTNPGTGGLTADTLYVAWHQTYDQQQIRNIIVEQLLTLDDDNGNLNDGTPHFDDINGGFMDHGYDGFVPDFMNFSNVTVLSDTPNEIGPYTVDANITAAINPPVGSATLFYQVNGVGGFIPVSMTNVGGNTWRGEIPGQQSVARVAYYVSASDSLGNDETFPEGGATSAFRFIVGDVTVMFFDNFDPAGDNGWTHGQIATQDDWNHKDPTGACGDPPSAFSGTRAWGNDLVASGTFNGCYGNNVNNWLRSPILNLSNSNNTAIRFRRWLQVEESQFDQARIRVNGSVMWVNPFSGHLLDTSWTPVEVDISSIADGNASVQIEFSMQSDGGLTFGGWTLDNFEILSIEESDPIVQTYCQGKINSSLCLPFISTDGFASVTSPTAFRIFGNEVVQNQIGILLYSLNGKSNLSFHNGTLCIKTPFTRALPGKNSGSGFPGCGGGQLLRNFNNIIQSGTNPALTTGVQVNAQWTYRDPGVDAFGDGLTNGVEFIIQP